MTPSPDIRKRRPGATQRARRLRRDETDAEYRLWYRLSGRELGGHKFLRQAPLGPYIVDFLCRAKRLVVELDGERHTDAAKDETRTVWLNSRGYSVLHFWNFEALRERKAVLDTILAVLEGQIASPSPGLRFAPADLSPVGRGTEPKRLAQGTRSAPESSGLTVKRPPLPNGKTSPPKATGEEGIE
jgi:very-short-patch-repair endonuclease